MFTNAGSYLVSEQLSLLLYTCRLRWLSFVTLKYGWSAIYFAWVATVLFHNSTLKSSDQDCSFLFWEKWNEMEWNGIDRLNLFKRLLREISTLWIFTIWKGSCKKNWYCINSHDNLWIESIDHLSKIRRYACVLDTRTLSFHIAWLCTYESKSCNNRWK